jgi:hypothetical protein
MSEKGQNVQQDGPPAALLTQPYRGCGRLIASLIGSY